MWEGDSAYKCKYRLRIELNINNLSMRQDKTRQDIYSSDPQIINIKYIQVVM